MSGRKNLQSNSTVRWMCAIVFITFSFLWLYGFQSDVLAAAQHVVSDGRTEYHPLLGAVLITVLLQVLQLLVYTVFRLINRGHALTYFPSMLALCLSRPSTPIYVRLMPGASGGFSSRWY